MTMGDRVALLNEGVLQQVDTPNNIYNKPNNTFVASFIGSPSMNLFRARLAGEGDAVTLELGSHRLSVPASVIAAHSKLQRSGMREVIVGIRPEDMDDAALNPGHPANQRLTSKVLITESLGSDQMVHFGIDAPVAKVTDADMIDDILADGKLGACIGRFDARSTAHPGATVEVAVTCDRLHFFDAASGVAL